MKLGGFRLTLGSDTTAQVQGWEGVAKPMNILSIVQVVHSRHGQPRTTEIVILQVCTVCDIDIVIKGCVRKNYEKQWKLVTVSSNINLLVDSLSKY